MADAAAEATPSVVKSWAPIGILVRIASGLSTKEVARDLRLTAAAVYLAKGRVMARLQALIRDVQEDE